MSVLEALERARRAWEQSQPQLFLDLDGVEEKPTRVGADGPSRSGFSSTPKNSTAGRSQTYQGLRAGGPQKGR